MWIRLMRAPACLINILGYCMLDQDGMPGYVLIGTINLYHPDCGTRCGFGNFPCTQGGEEKAKQNHTYPGYIRFKKHHEPPSHMSCECFGY